MKINLTLFNERGKYKYGGDVEISDDLHLWSNNFKQEIINNQKIVVDSALTDGDYFILTQDTDENMSNPNYTKFFTHLFMKDAFKGMMKQVNLI